MKNKLASWAWQRYKCILSFNRKNCAILQVPFVSLMDYWKEKVSSLVRVQEVESIASFLAMRVFTVAKLGLGWCGCGWKCAFLTPVSEVCSPLWWVVS